MNKQLSFKMPVVDEKETKSRRGSFLKSIDVI